ncbi:Hypothetical predicted protein [Paramuricea clavata]|uniref:Uncharacterized protein n=1 Tax=Paramuricea clavata TaxID=317549 RepID=A0A7D9DMB5_PARCT|nr:Hypothetical predicted protein [Paramuricea clavata]
MRTNVLEKARERGLEIEEKINNHFDELLKKEKRRIIGKELKSAARQFQRRRKQTEADVRKVIRDAKRWKSDIAKEERRRRKEVTDWKTEAQKWKRRPSDCGGTQRPAKGELRKTGGSQRVSGKHAIKVKVKKYVITPNGNYDPAYFLTITEDEVKTLINSETELRNVRMSLACEMARSDPKTGGKVSTIAHFG